MDSGNRLRMYQCAENALMRAAAQVESALPDWPVLSGDSASHARRWSAWLHQVWTVDPVAEAIEHASPVLARQVEAMLAQPMLEGRSAERVALSVARYVLRMTGRATPFGLFAGVAPISFGNGLAVTWGTPHRPVARADASWLTEVIALLESCPPLLARLPLTANNASFVRGRRLVVPYPRLRQGTKRTTPVETSMRYSPAVRTAVQAAESPIRYDQLARMLAAEFPATRPDRIDGLLKDLVDRRALISSLHAPSTVVDAFEYLMDQLDHVGAGTASETAALLDQLTEIREALTRHNDRGAAGERRGVRTAVVAQMATVSVTARQPLALDLRLDCSIRLPAQVAREAEDSATVLARLSPDPFGTTAWKTYHNRFFDRYGIGALVPVLDVVDPDIGLGFPAGYLNAEPEPREPLSIRDQRLLALAQTAAMDGHDELILDDRLIADLRVGDHTRVQMPPHLELCFQLHAASSVGLEGGEFELAVVNMSRGIGTTTGRFVGLLEHADQQVAATVFDRLPASDPDTTVVQLSFPPLDPADAHVTRAPQLLPAVISIGEYRPPGATMIPLEDLAVGCDSRRLYLASVSRRCRLEPTVMHALDLRAHTPPLARFLAEVSRAQVAVVSGFSWGAASALPFLPRVRYRRTILSPARWRLDRSELPGREASWLDWQKAFVSWCSRRRVPDVVFLTERDRLLRLETGESAHLALLRAHLNSAPLAVLTEGTARATNGWCDGRAHEIVVPLTATQPTGWPRVPAVTVSRVIGRDHGLLPGASTWLLAKLYGHVTRQAEILADHLPQLWRAWDEPPAWWYMRYRDPDWHLRLRIALPDAAAFGPAARRVSVWVDALRCHGLLRGVQFATSYPETGRWGTGAVLAAAEEVFGADSRALVTQFSQPSKQDSQVLAAAQFVAITTAFTGSAEAGMDWIVTNARTEAATALDRSLLAEAVRLGDPADDWAALRATRGGHEIYQAWQPRDRALADYRARLEQAAGINPDSVLDSLLHAHHIRAVGIDRDDERTCLRLARAAALAWNARRTWTGARDGDQ